MYYEWNTIEDFNNWHNALCQSLGYPLTPINQATGLPDENAQKTTSYTDPIVQENRIIAFVDSEYSAGLKKATEPIFTEIEQGV